MRGLVQKVAFVGEDRVLVRVPESVNFLYDYKAGYLLSKRGWDERGEWRNCGMLA